MPKEAFLHGRFWQKVDQILPFLERSIDAIFFSFVELGQEVVLDDINCG